MIGMRTATITSKGQIAIPKSLRNQKGFSEGSKVVIMAFHDHVELRPLESISSALVSEKVLGKEWDKEDELWKGL